MFGLTQQHLQKRCAQLERRVTVLLEVRDKLSDQNHQLKTDNETLQQKKQMDDEMIAHKLKMREESVQLDADKRISTAERAAAKEKDDGIAKVKDKYRDKLENQLEKRGDEMKEMYSEILTRLPDVNLSIKQKG